MKLKDCQSYEHWAEHVQKFEYQYALDQLAKGQDINIVMEAMAMRIQKKMLHPAILAIKEVHTRPFDAEASRRSYFEKYKNFGPVADHVLRDED